MHIDMMHDARDRKVKGIALYILYIYITDIQYIYIYIYIDRYRQVGTRGSSSKIHAQ